MRRIGSLILTIVLALGMCACGQSAKAEWQEQYDLGIRYLSEGRYEEAIIAFTAAIEIDPKRPEGYTGRGDAYALSGDTEENLSAALADYEAALALDMTIVDAWLGLADVYIRQGKVDKAMEVLQEALGEIEDERIKEKMEQLNDPFLNSPYYVPYETLTEDVQLLVSQVIDKLHNASTQEINQFLYENYVEMVLREEAAILIWTVCGDYRIKLGSITSYNPDSIEYQQYGARVEIHPQNGTGYYHSIFIVEQSMDMRLVKGQCSDWNWNGEFEYYRYDNAEDDGMPRVREIWNHGNCVNGLVDGMLEVEEICDGEHQVRVEEYQNGKRLDVDIEALHTPEGAVDPFEPWH